MRKSKGNNDNTKEPLARRLAFRLSEQDYERLVELRLALHLGNDAQTVRALIRFTSSSPKTREALRKARRDPQHKTRVQTLVDGKQLDMFRGSK